ncbi:MAG: efflux RND transporter periplasmic adaptor subunit [Deltaproteobacteria bacterium]|nr:efflux RND transporter periplasmic adaptor subunit [Deltaproteobacteria bacterium]
MKPIPGLLLTGLLMMSGCSGETIPRSAEATVRTQPKIVDGVSTKLLQRQPVLETLTAVGTVRSRQQSVMAAKSIATVVALHVRAGDRVRTGQVLVELDDRDVQARLRRTQAALRDAHDAVEEVEQSILAADKTLQAAHAQAEFAHATLSRHTALLARRAVAPQEYEAVVATAKTATAEEERAHALKAAVIAKKRQVLARIDQAEADVTDARVAVSFTVLTAPWAGVVVAKTTEVGNMATPGTPLLTIEKEDYVLEAAVREAEIAHIQLGQQGTIQLATLGKTVTSTVNEIMPRSDPQSRTFTVKLALPADPTLRSGFYGTVAFPTGQHEGVVVPVSAIVERGQLQGVFVLNPETIASFRLVKLGKVFPEGIEILSGVDVGERIIVEGAHNVADGNLIASVQ